MSRALPLLRQLVVDNALVLEVAATGNLLVGPEPNITGENDAAIRAARDELVALARLIDPATQDRWRTFAAQYAARPEDVVTPTFAYRRNLPYVPHRCHSCGESLPRGFRWGRCSRCAVAWRLVVDTPVGEAWMLHYDEAQVRG